ncbi:Radical SAM domain-containing protein [Candidatus Magnetomorum sp. HK-1]|nr:Radical SAM domain-containing protein [Candidatus Magnetomorum sp. HK-1]
MKILLINPNNLLEKILGSGKIFASPDMPMGLFYIASYLQKFGYHVVFRDSYLHNDDYDVIVKKIKDEDPKIIGISCLTANGKFVFELGQIIKRKFTEKLLVLGNLHASIFSNFYLNNKAADVIVHGEGEIAFKEICDSFREGQSFSFKDIKGISYIDEENKIINNEQRKYIKNLDLLPFPYPDNINLNDYPRMKDIKLPYIKIISSRGCVNNCTFCAVHNNRNYRMRSINNVIEEIEYTKKKFNINFVSFEDALFTASKKRIIELCSKIIEKKLNIEWGCEGHINFIDEELMKIMRKAGCIGISYGIESGNQDILNSINKKTRLDDIKKKVLMSKYYFKKISGLFILGLPNETKQTIEQTIKLSLELPFTTAQFSLFTPYPGSQLYYDFIQNGVIAVDENKPEELINSWERYSSYAIFAKDAPHPIYVPENLTLNDLKKLQKKALRKFYFRLSYMLKNRPVYLDLLSFKDFPNLVKSILKLLK